MLPAPAGPKWTRAQARARLRLPSPYFLSRGYPAAILDAFDVGESDRLGGRAVAPVFDDTGEMCVGYISRSVRPDCGRCRWSHAVGEGCGAGEPRWDFPLGFTKGDWLYNFAAAIRTGSSHVLLVEGVPDVLRAAEGGVVAVSGFGTSLSPGQGRKLASLGAHVIVALDNDYAGRKSGISVSRRLAGLGIRVEVRHPPAGVKDVGEMTAAAVAAWYPEAVSTCGAAPLPFGMGRTVPVGALL